MKNLENKSIPINLYADYHSVEPSRIKRLNKILNDQTAKYVFEFDPFTNSLTIQIFSEFGSIYSVIPEGDSNNEN